MKHIYGNNCMDLLFRSWVSTQDRDLYPGGRLVPRGRLVPKREAGTQGEASIPGGG